MAEQLSIFEYKAIAMPRYPIKLFECFAGIGTTRMALANLYGEDNIVSLGISEIKKGAIVAYLDIWGNTANYGDITQIHKLPNGIDILTWSFPCQDLSRAGKNKGIVKGVTRSGLCFEIPRIIANTDVKPSILLMGNVPQVERDPQFITIKAELSEIGYFHSTTIRLQGRDAGIPQLRKRSFMVSVLGDDSIQNLTIANTIRAVELDFRTLCEDKVSSNYYISLKQLTAMAFTPFKTTRHGRVVSKDIKILPALCETEARDLVKVFVDKSGKARRLTEREYWRLMGIDDKYFNRLTTQGKHLYGLAGDAIIVPCMELIWQNVFNKGGGNADKERV